jgi:PBP1b-binding outer membrane lipoprotein LpoB
MKRIVGALALLMLILVGCSSAPSKEGAAAAEGDYKASPKRPGN